jgi:hypothetical protein
MLSMPQKKEASHGINIFPLPHLAPAQKMRFFAVSRFCLRKQWGYTYKYLILPSFGDIELKPIILTRVLLVLLLFASLFVLLPLTVTRGAPTAARTCDEAGLDAALAAGGMNTFSCTTAAAITVSTTKTVSLSGTVLDGGGLLAFSGGGVRRVFSVNSGVTATFQNLTITQGSAANGAAINSLGPLIITNSYFLNNAVTGDAGAIFANGGTGQTLTINGSTFSGNTAAGGSGNMDGGALFIASGTATITNSTFYNNTAQRGGAILTSGSSTLLTVAASTFSGNIATIGYGASGIFNTNGTVTLQNTILNTSSDRNCNGSITDGGNNLQYGGAANSCGSFATGNPMLGPLANNGGMTPTMALLTGSAALDKIPANQCIVTTDQRGYHRPAFGGSSTTCDIGAFEVQQLIYLPLISK